MIVDRTVTGWIIVSALVTDGRDEWLHTERFMDYTSAEARAIYAESVTRNGWSIV